MRFSWRTDDTPLPATRRGSTTWIPRTGSQEQALRRSPLPGPGRWICSGRWPPMRDFAMSHCEARRSRRGPPLMPTAGTSAITTLWFVPSPPMANRWSSASDHLGSTSLHGRIQATRGAFFAFRPEQKRVPRSAGVVYGTLCDAGSSQPRAASAKRASSAPSSIDLSSGRSSVRNSCNANTACAASAASVRVPAQAVSSW